MTDTQSLAIFLYAAGGVFAIVGPAIAAVRLIAKHRNTRHLTGSAAELNASVDPVKVSAATFSDAAWGVGEFALVGLGVALASIASIVSVIGS